MNPDNAPGSYTLAQVVDEYIVSRRKDPAHYASYVTLALAGVREANIYSGSQSVRTRQIDLNPDTASAPLPSDCVRVTSAAICFPNGEYLLLGHTQGHCPDDAEDPSSFCPSDAPTESERFQRDCDYVSRGTTPPWYAGASYGVSFDVFTAGRYVGARFAVGAGYIPGGMWSVNERTRVLRLHHVCAASAVVIRYISNGVSADGAIYVPYEAINMLQAYLDYQDSLASVGAAQARGVQMKFAEYKRQFNLNWGLGRGGTSIQRIAKSFRRNVSAKPKR